MQPQLLQELSEALLGNWAARVSGVQEESLQVQRSLQSGSEKRLWSCAAGQETEFTAGGGQDELQPARGEV